MLGWQWTFDISLMMSWYLLLAAARPACSRFRRFLRIFLFFCSRGSWLSSRTAGLLFRPSGVWASCTARRSTTNLCSNSFSGWVVLEDRITRKKRWFLYNIVQCFFFFCLITCGAVTGVSRISGKFSPGWIRITSTISFLVLKQTGVNQSVIYLDLNK